jgi:hypothetical protein
MFLLFAMDTYERSPVTALCFNTMCCYFIYSFPTKDSKDPYVKEKHSRFYMLLPLSQDKWIYSDSVKILALNILLISQYFCIKLFAPLKSNILTLLLANGLALLLAISTMINYRSPADRKKWKPSTWINRIVMGIFLYWILSQEHYKIFTKPLNAELKDPSSFYTPALILLSYLLSTLLFINKQDKIKRTLILKEID